MTPTTTTTPTAGATFSAPSILAMKAGRKTQHRFIIPGRPHPWTEKGPDVWSISTGRNSWTTNERLEVVTDTKSGEKSERSYLMAVADWLLERCPYKPGDVLWVKEAWSPDHRSFYPCFSAVYRADGYPSDDDVRGWRTDLSPRTDDDKAAAKFRWRAARTMPRWASRLFLLVESRRAERVQDISAADIVAEGVIDRPHHVDGLGKCPVSAIDGVCYPDLRSLWARAWESTNGNGAWARDDWVWAVTFRVLTEAPHAT